MSQWLIAFELVEHLSVAEKKESREEPKKALQQKVNGTGASEAPPETEELTGFMGVLKKLDEMLA